MSTQPTHRNYTTVRSTSSNNNTPTQPTQQQQPDQHSVLSTFFGRLSSGRVCWDEMSAAQKRDVPVLTPRGYQRELVQLVQDTNALITLPTGAMGGPLLLCCFVGEAVGPLLCHSPTTTVQQCSPTYSPQSALVPHVCCVLSCYSKPHNRTTCSLHKHTCRCWQDAGCCRGHPRQASTAQGIQQSGCVSGTNQPPG